MAEQELPYGLRHVLVHVTFGAQKFPPRPDSKEDIALLRAGNRALQRKAKGMEDVFVFVFSRASIRDDEAIAKAITTYGFPNALCLIPGSLHLDVASGKESDDVSEQWILEAELEDIRIAIGRWLQEHHPGAIAFSGEEYQEANFWWSGVEHNDAVFDWPFSTEAYAESLPDTHRQRAATWLSLMGHAVDLHEIQATSPEALGRDQAAAWAATLCEWLHGFEAASGNGYNHFTSEYSWELMPSEFFLGFELARIAGDDLDSLCDAHDADVDGLSMAAMQAITGGRRGELRTALTDFFGGDSALFWALHSAIWPAFDKSMSDALTDKLGHVSYDDMAELDTPWRYVSEGWCEDADD
jgi:hypothetical protein